MEWNGSGKKNGEFVGGRTQGGLGKERGTEHLMGFRWGLVPDLPEDHLSLLIFPR